jgi:hypothetical protein
MGFDVLDDITRLTTADRPLRVTMSEQSPEPFEVVRWSTLDREEFAELYWESVAPRFAAACGDPGTQKPPHQWLRDEGLRSFLAALRRHHGLSFGEFWNEDLRGDIDDGYDWATDNDATVDALTVLGSASRPSRRRRLVGSDDAQAIDREGSSSELDRYPESCTLVGRIRRVPATDR